MIHQMVSMLACITQCINSELCYFITYNYLSEACSLFAIGLTNYIVAGVQLYAQDAFVLAVFKYLLIYCLL